MKLNSNGFMALIILWINNVFSQTSNMAIGSGMDVDNFENIYITGSLDGQAMFGRFVLTEQGGGDVFFAKYNKKGACVWAVSAGGKGTDAGQSVKVDAIGNIYVTGYVGGNATFDDYKLNAEKLTKMFLAKYSTSGDVVWLQTISSKTGNQAFDVAVDTKGNSYITGIFSETIYFDKKTSLTSAGADDIFIAKYSSTGKILWAAKFGGTLYDEVKRIEIDGLGNSVITGQTTKANGASKAFIAKFSNNGTLVWQKEIDHDNNNCGQDVAIDKSGNIYVSGINFMPTPSNPNALGNYDIFLSAYDASGTNKWKKLFASENNDYANSIITDNSGNIYITGHYSDELKFDKFKLYNVAEDVYVSKFNKSGDCLWAISGKSNGEANGDNLCVDLNGNIYSLGSVKKGLEFDGISLSATSQSTIFMARFNPSDGKCNWATTVKLTSDERNPNAKYVNYYAKLLVNKNNTETFLSDQNVMLNDSVGETVYETKTDANGDFSFRQIDKTQSYNVVVEKNDSMDGASLLLATRAGFVVKKLTPDAYGKIGYKLESSDPTLLTNNFFEDNTTKIKTFFGKKEPTLLVKENIEYESNSFDIPENAKQSLIAIAKSLKSHLLINLEIYSHTDAIGDEQTNLELSKKRAVEVMNFLVEKGVPKERLKSEGKGESEILNRCKNGVECSDKEHQFNRRTEFKFIKIDPNTKGK